MEEHKEIQSQAPRRPKEKATDDFYDGLFRDVVSREVALREGRDEGHTVVFEARPGEESVAVGRREDLDRFHQFLSQEKANYREIEVEEFPTDPEKQKKLGSMLLPRLSKARERVGLPNLPILSPVVEGLLETSEDAVERAGIPLESKGTASETIRPDEIEKALEGFEPKFND